MRLLCKQVRRTTAKKLERDGCSPRCVPSKYMFKMNVQDECGSGKCIGSLDSSLALILKGG
jgi:hypothetical protein